MRYQIRMGHELDICTCHYTVCDSCVWQLCVTVVCDSCVWQLCVTVVCDSCVWQLCATVVWHETWLWDMYMVRDTLCYSLCVTLCHTILIERTPGVFLSTMFPDQELCVRDFTTRGGRRIGGGGSVDEYGAWLLRHDCVTRMCQEAHYEAYVSQCVALYGVSHGCVKRDTLCHILCVTLHSVWYLYVKRDMTVWHLRVPRPHCVTFVFHSIHCVTCVCQTWHDRVVFIRRKTQSVTFMCHTIRCVTLVCHWIRCVTCVCLTWHDCVMFTCRKTQCVAFVRHTERCVTLVCHTIPCETFVCHMW